MPAQEPLAIPFVIQIGGLEPYSASVAAVIPSDQQRLTAWNAAREERGQPRLVTCPSGWTADTIPGKSKYDPTPGWFDELVGHARDFLLLEILRRWDAPYQRYFADIKTLRHQLQKGERWRIIQLIEYEQGTAAAKTCVHEVQGAAKTCRKCQAKLSGPELSDARKRVAVAKQEEERKAQEAKRAAARAQVEAAGQFHDPNRMPSRRISPHAVAAMVAALALGSPGLDLPPPRFRSRKFY